MAEEKTAPKGIDGMIALFEALVPPDGVIITDVAGNQYQLPAAIPMRRQIKVVRTMEALKDAVIDDDAAGTVGALLSGKLQGKDVMFGIGKTIVALCQSEDVMVLIERAFAEAHPAVSRAAVQAVLAQDPDATGPADAFGIEDIVAGLLPFFGRLLKRIAQTIGSMESLQAVMDEPTQ